MILLCWLLRLWNACDTCKAVGTARIILEKRGAVFLVEARYGKYGVYEQKQGPTASNNNNSDILHQDKSSLDLSMS